MLLILFCCKCRLEDLRSVTRSNLAVEQRIEVARRQQAARAAARIDREHARLAREIEKNEKQEAAKRDREVRSQQLMEVSPRYSIGMSFIFLCFRVHVTNDVT